MEAAVQKNSSMVNVREKKGEVNLCGSPAVRQKSIESASLFCHLKGNGVPRQRPRPAKGIKGRGWKKTVETAVHRTSATGVQNPEFGQVCRPRGSGKKGGRLPGQRLVTAGGKRNFSETSTAPLAYPGRLGTHGNREDSAFPGGIDWDYRTT